MPFHLSLSKAKIKVFNDVFHKLTDLEPNVKNFRSIENKRFDKFTLDQLLILKILSREIKPDEESKMILGDDDRIKKASKVSFDRKSKPIKNSEILAHFKALKEKKYTHAYIRFGDGNLFTNPDRHKEAFKIFFGGISKGVDGVFHRKDGRNFKDIDGNDVQQSSIDSCYKNFVDKNEYLNKQGVSEFDECKSVGGIIHEIDSIILFLENTKSRNIYAIPAYEKDSERDVANDGEPYVSNCGCTSTNIGKTTLILSTKKNLRPTLIGKIISTLQQTQEYSYDIGQGCCPD